MASGGNRQTETGQTGVHASRPLRFGVLRVVLAKHGKDRVVQPRHVVARVADRAYRARFVLVPAQSKRASTHNY